MIYKSFHNTVSYNLEFQHQSYYHCDLPSTIVPSPPTCPFSKIIYIAYNKMSNGITKKFTNKNGIIKFPTFDLEFPKIPKL